MTIQRIREVIQNTKNEKERLLDKIEEETRNKIIRLRQLENNASQISHIEKTYGARVLLANPESRNGCESFLAKLKPVEEFYSSRRYSATVGSLGSEIQNVRRYLDMTDRRLCNRSLTKENYDAIMSIPSVDLLKAVMSGEIQ